MDALTAACIVLMLTTLSFAFQAAYWWKVAKRRERTALELAIKGASAHTKGYVDGLTMGLKQGTGGMYLAATRAGADEDVLTALRAAGRKLLNEPMEEPVVQVPVAS